MYNVIEKEILRQRMGRIKELKLGYLTKQKWMYMSKNMLGYILDKITFFHHCHEALEKN